MNCNYMGPAHRHTQTFKLGVLTQDTRLCTFASFLFLLVPQNETRLPTRLVCFDNRERAYETRTCRHQNFDYVLWRGPGPGPAPFACKMACSCSAKSLEAQTSSLYVTLHVRYFTCLKNVSSRHLSDATQILQWENKQDIFLCLKFARSSLPFSNVCRSVAHLRERLEYKNKFECKHKSVHTSLYFILTVGILR